MGAPLALAFAAGLLAAFNPCGFALLPAYLAYFIGVAGDDRPSPLRATGRALAVSGTLTLGFAAVFGAVVTLASVQVTRIAPWFTVVIGLALIGLGAAMARGFEPRLSLPRMSRGATRGAGLPGIFLFGVSYATVSLSCTLPPSSRRWPPPSRRPAWAVATPPSCSTPLAWAACSPCSAWPSP